LLLTWAVSYLPWSLLHVPAIARAVVAITRSVRAGAGADPASVSRGVLGAFYLGWLVQAALLQRPHEYVMMTTVFPAVVLIAGTPWAGCGLSLAQAFLVDVALLAALFMPGLRPQRLLLWAWCWREGSTAELRDRLGLMPPAYSGATGWRDLARVADFLRAKGIADGELTCLSGGTHPLYLELQLESSTRFHLLGMAACSFPSRAEQLRAELAASRSRYVVSDLIDGAGLTYAQALEEVPGRSLALPPDFPADRLGRYPWCEPLVFRAGRYVVHRARGPATRFW
jgi:hypothetical protein